MGVVTPPNAAALCAFAQHGFRLWRRGALGKVLAEKWDSLTMRMTRGGENTAQMAQSMYAELKLDDALGDVS